MRYVYFGKTKESTGHKGIVCVGFDTIRKLDDRYVLRFGVSYCCPGDPFSRKKAHKIITGRVDKGVFQEVVVDKEPTFEEAIRVVLDTIELPDNERVIKWAKPVIEAAKNG